MTSSAPTRSGVIRSISAAIAVIAATTRGAGANDSWETNRAARSIRSGSSRNDCSGVPGVSSTRAASCSSPPNGSTNWCSGSETAIALTAKSRRSRSPSSESPKVTTGLRVSPS